MAEVAPTKTPEEIMADALKNATGIVKQQAYYMKRALDNENRDEALKHASTMISELSTSALSPKMYYDLYMSVFDQLRFIEEYFLDEWKKGSSIFDLYEHVQHANNILPRLYLLVTVGSVYIKSEEAPAKDVLKDLVEMCRGVQHPMRGLFLRDYLSKLSKDKLPDSENKYTGKGGSVRDSVDFILQNFTEMNKLWVRMQHQGPIREKERREKERTELRILVGTNLVRLSNLTGVDIELYSSVVLPRVLEQVVNCKDPIAQEYLMDCIIQVFPDEYHLRTLDDFLQTIENLQPLVNKKDILISLMDRISRFAAEAKKSKDEAQALPADINGFQIFSDHVKAVTEGESAAQLGVEGHLTLQTSLTKFARSCYPDRLEYVDSAFKTCTGILQDNEGEGDFGPQIVALLSIPLDTNSDVLDILKLENFPGLMAMMPNAKRKEVAARWCQSLITTNANLTSVEIVTELFKFIEPLCFGEDVAEKDEDEDDDDDDDTNMTELESEQNLLARLVHLMRTDDLDTLHKLYNGTRKFFGGGGEKRIKYTFPPLVTNAISLAVKLKVDAEKEGGSSFKITSKKVFQFCHSTASELKDAKHSDIALRLFLNTATGAGACGFGAVCHECFEQAYTIWEDDIHDSKAQLSALVQIIGTLRSLQPSSLTEEEYSPLAKQVVKAGAKLMKKQDQCKALYLSSHLFWMDERSGGTMRDDKKVLECLKKALKIADAWSKESTASSTHLALFVEILNQYLYFFEAGYEEMKTYIPALLQVIDEYIKSATDTSDAVQIYYQNTISSMKANPAFEGIEF